MLAGCTLVSAFAAAPALAQEYRYRPIRIIAPNPPGAAQMDMEAWFDIFARILRMIHVSLFTYKNARLLPE
jgi:tripartite-type tricarboxylate transporter receptor subunit TctC